jgi:hypothetical protein
MATGVVGVEDEDEVAGRSSGGQELAREPVVS